MYAKTSMPRVNLVIVMYLALLRTVSCEINIVSSNPPSGHVVEKGGTVTFSCETDRRWFLCLWTSPLGAKVCSIQESDAGASQVCQWDHSAVQGEDNKCGFIIANVTSEDRGPWMCLMQDGEGGRREIDLEIGSRADVGCWMLRRWC